MKIGVLTHYHKSINYGGVLQAYALCYFLNRLGCSALQISYESKNKSLYKKKYTVHTLKNKIISKSLKALFKKENIRIKQRMESLFVDFRKQIPHTIQVYNKNNISSIGNEFDVIMVGSDQVWNPLWFDSSYMLDFVKEDVMKISYAASMGVQSLTDEQESIYEQYLESFDCISVREEEGAKCIKSFINKEIEVCVDPTLLLTVDEWNDLASDRVIKEKYVFLYMLGDDIKARRLASEFAKSKGLKLVYIPDLLGNFRLGDRFIKGESLLTVTPCDFLSLIKYAECVITDSFHACVFSLVFKREFFVFERNRKSNEKTSSRISNLIRMFECPERFLKYKETMRLTYMENCKTIDFSKKNKEFENIRNKSYEFIKEALSKNLDQ